MQSPQAQLIVDPFESEEIQAVFQGIFQFRQ